MEVKFSMWTIECAICKHQKYVQKKMSYTYLLADIQDTVIQDTVIQDTVIQLEILPQGQQCYHKNHRKQKKKAY
jgi:hypothetical protein